MKFTAIFNSFFLDNPNILSYLTPCKATRNPMFAHQKHINTPIPDAIYIRIFKIFSYLGALLFYRNPKSEIRNPKSEIRNPKSEIRNPKSEIRNPKSEIPLERWKMLHTTSTYNPECYYHPGPVLSLNPEIHTGGTPPTEKVAGRPSVLRTISQ